METFSTGLLAIDTVPEKGTMACTRSECQCADFRPSIWQAYKCMECFHFIDDHGSGKKGKRNQNSPLHRIRGGTWLSERSVRWDREANSLANAFEKGISFESQSDMIPLIKKTESKEEKIEINPSSSVQRHSADDVSKEGLAPSHSSRHVRFPSHSRPAPPPPTPNAPAPKSLTLVSPDSESADSLETHSNPTSRPTSRDWEPVFPKKRAAAISRWKSTPALHGPTVAALLLPGSGREKRDSPRDRMSSSPQFSGRDRVSSNTNSSGTSLLATSQAVYDAKVREGSGDKFAAFRAAAKDTGKLLARTVFSRHTSGIDVFSDLKPVPPLMLLGVRSPDDRFLRFSVTKFSHQRKQQRDYQVDLFEGTVANLNPKNRGVKEWPIISVSRMDKSWEDPTQLRLCFEWGTYSSNNNDSEILLSHTEKQGRDNFARAHDYLLKFRSVAEREEFYLGMLTAREALKSRMSVQNLVKSLAPSPELEPISVFVGTWNMGNAAPPDSLSWIPINKYDLYAIGVQECQYPPRAEPVHFSSCEVDWAHTLETHIGPNYAVVVFECLWEIRLFVAVRKVHVSKITCVETANVATGIANVLGNKGGVGLALKFNETSFCFINAHLAAHLGNVSHRIENFIDIVASLDFGQSVFDVCQFDNVFFFGDLNFRLSLSESDPSVHYDCVDGIRRQSYAALLEYDQLLNEQAAKTVLYGFSEGEISFPPSYKFLRPRPASEPDYYCTDRTPSWCDRILCRTSDQSRMRLLSYNCHLKTLTSDHVPVSATFEVDTVKAFLRALYSFHLAGSVRSARPVSISLMNVSGFIVGMRATSRRSRIANIDGTLPDSNAELLGGRTISVRPFIEVRGSFINTLPPTKACPKLKVPARCSFGSIGPIQSIYPSMSFLRCQHLLIGVYDATLVHSDAESTRCLGMCHLPLSNACAAHARLGEAVKFEVDLSHHGQSAGKLTGEIVVH